MNQYSIGVIGSGSWATAIVKILTNNCDKINWWIREPEIIDNLKNFKHNPTYLSSIEFDVNKLSISNDISEVIIKSDILVFCVPAPPGVPILIVPTLVISIPLADFLPGVTANGAFKKEEV